MFDRTFRNSAVRTRYNEPMRSVAGIGGLSGKDPSFSHVLENAAFAIAHLTVDPPCPTSLDSAEQIEWLYNKCQTVEWNEAYATQYGFDKDCDMSRVPIQEIFPLADERNLKFARRFVTNRYRVTREETFERDRFGVAKTFLIACSGTVLNGAVTDVWISMIDVSALKRAQEENKELDTQLHAAERLKAVGQLTSGVAHDFNNILASVIGYAELASDTLDSTHDERLNGYVAEIRRASYRARDLVTQLLSFSRRRHSESDITDVAELVDSVVRLLHPTMPATIDIQTTTEAAFARIDAVQLEQILINLCINARDAMQNRGTFRISTARGSQVSQRCAACDCEFSGKYVAVSVDDSGPGIDDTRIAKVFRPFYSTKATGAGSGLGLTMVDKIAHAHRGHVSIHSQPESGTTVTIFLPESQQVEASATRHPPREAPESGLISAANVLVVDDDRSVGTLLGQLLESRGFNATVVSDSETALRLFKRDRESIDIVVTDQTMPKLTGVELSEAILSIDPELPIVLCSGYSCDVDAKAARQLGIRGYQNKPIEADEFIGQICKLLDAA